MPSLSMRTGGSRGSGLAPEVIRPPGGDPAPRAIPAAPTALPTLTVPCAAYFLLDKFGAPGVVAGVAAGAGLSLAAAKVGKEKTKSEQELRSLRKKQEAVLNELASNLPIWKLCKHGS